MYWAFYHKYLQEHAIVRQCQISSNFYWPATKHSFSNAWRTSSSPDWKAMPVHWRNDDLSMGQIQCTAITIQHQVSTFPGRVGGKECSAESKKTGPHLRDFYQHKLSEFHSYQLAFFDESRCDKQIGCRQTGWSPLGMTPVQLPKFHQGQHYQILPAYAQDGIILSLNIWKVAPIVWSDFFWPVNWVTLGSHEVKVYSIIGFRGRRECCSNFRENFPSPACGCYGASWYRVLASVAVYGATLPSEPEQVLYLHSMSTVP